MIKILIDIPFHLLPFITSVAFTIAASPYMPSSSSTETTTLSNQIIAKYRCRITANIRRIKLRTENPAELTENNANPTVNKKIEHSVEVLKRVEKKKIVIKKIISRIVISLNSVIMSLKI
ncbi:hypothetical protein IEQ34_026486 [Dendrobium chrysotoxum]|uniref:Uncharacterized protein n=1 Tax=Dendrobium chrysotoxum TaxID=161865 RepID=A0AAV7FMC5_DENCH|nr:hypothetical protein IEQ34_026486 [Dendrobium chrysotoxum]